MSNCPLTGKIPPPVVFSRFVHYRSGALMFQVPSVPQTTARDEMKHMFDISKF